MKKIGKKTIKTNNWIRDMSKFSIFQSLVKTAHITSTIELLFMIKEYDTISKFSLCSQKLNPSYDNRGSIYTNMGYWWASKT